MSRHRRLDLISAFGQDPEEEEDPEYTERGLRLVENLKREVAAGADPDQQEVPFTLQQKLQRAQGQAAGERQAREPGLGDEILGAVDEATDAIGQALGFDGGRALTRDFVQGEEAGQRVDALAGADPEGGAAQASTFVQPNVQPTPEEELPELRRATVPRAPLPPDLERERRMAGIVTSTGQPDDQPGGGQPAFPEVRRKWFNRDPERIRRISAMEADARARRFGMNIPSDDLSTIATGGVILDSFVNGVADMTANEQTRQAAEMLQFVHGLTGIDALKQRSEELQRMANLGERTTPNPFGAIKRADGPVEMLSGFLFGGAQIVGSALGLMWASKEEAAAGAVLGSVSPDPVTTGMGAMAGLGTGIYFGFKNRTDRDFAALAEREDAPDWIKNPLTRDIASAGISAISASLEVAMEGRLAREGLEAIVESARRRGVRNMFRSRILQSARQEAGEETGQLFVGEAARAMGGAELGPRELGIKAIESIAAGAIGGAGIGSATVLPQKGLESYTDVMNEITSDDFTPGEQPGGMIELVGRQRVIENPSDLSDSQLVAMWAEASTRNDEAVVNAVKGEFQRRAEEVREGEGPEPGQPSSMASEAQSEGQTDQVRGVPTGAEARAELQVGDVVGKRKVVDITESGSIRWKAVDNIRAEEGPTENEYSTGTFVPAPEDTEIEDFIQRRRAEPPTPDLPEARMEAVEMAAAESGIQMNSEDFNRFVMDTRKIRTDYQGQALTEWRQATSDQSDLGRRAFQRKQDQLVAIGTSSQLDIDPTVRSTALAQAMAMEDVRQRSGQRTPDAIGIDEAALKIARMDEQNYQQWQTFLGTRQAQNQVNERISLRAQQFREEGLAQEEAERDYDRVEDLVAQGNVRSSRGASEGTRIRMENGEIGEIVNRPNFGTAMVNFSDRKEKIDLAQPGVDIIPRAGELFAGAAGNVYRAENLMDSSSQFSSPSTAQRVQARAPDGSSVQVDLGDVTRVGNNPDSKAQLEDAMQEAQRRAREQGLIELRAQQMGVLKQTGQEVTVDAISDTHLRITDPQSGASSIVSRDDVGIGSTSVTDPSVDTPAITTFEPGTTPTREGYHINFLRLNRADAASLKENFRAAAEGEEAGAEAVQRSLQTFSNEGKLFLAPQPTNPNQELVAIELPAEARSLTDAAKRLLGVFGGNEPLESISPQTTQARVRVNPEQLQDLLLYEVPPGLQQSIKSPFELRDPDAPGSVVRNEEQVRDYLSRLPDLNFEMIPESSEALSEAKELAGRVEFEKETGDWGAAEQTTLEVQDRLSEARQREFEAARDALNEAWEAATQEVREEEMALEDVRLLDQLEEGNLEAVREALIQMPGARGRETGIPAVFDHPTVPGFRMVVRKETVLTRQGGRPMSREQAEDVLQNYPEIREEFGVGEKEVELPNGTTVERSLVDQLSTEQYLRLAQGSRVGGTRDIYNVSYLSPDGRQVLHRRIGADGQFEVPRSQEGRAREIIEAEVSRGRDPMERLKDELGDREEREVVKLPDLEGLYELVSEGEEDVILESLRTGEQVTIGRQQMAAAQFETAKEPMTTVSLPRRLSEEETLDEVVKKIGDMDSRARWYSTGEFRHNAIPGKYGEVRQREDGDWMAMVYEEPQDSNKIADKRSALTRKLQFDTQEEAQQWLEEHGMSPGAQELQFARRFRQLPEVESISVANMAKVEKSMRQIIRGYLMLQDNFIPQPVRTYANEFAVRWYQMGMPEQMMDGKQGIYGDWRIRRALNIFTVKDLQHAAANVDHEVIPNDYRMTEGILLDGPESSLDPQKIQHAREVYKDWQERTRLIEHSLPADQLPVDQSVGPDPKTLTQRHRLVKFGDEERVGSIIRSDVKTGSPVTVQYFENQEAKTIELPRSEVIPVYSENVRDQYIRSAKEAKGELLEVSQTPDMGQGSLDRRMGLDGVTNREVFEEKFIENASRMLGDLNRFDETDDIQYLDETVQNAKEVFIRMKELGLNRAERVLIPEDSPIRMIVEREALADLQSEYSPTSPLGDVVARAKLDLLSEEQKEAIEHQKTWLGLPKSAPDYKVVEYLAQNAWEPQFANVLWNLRNDMGFLNMTAELDEVIEELAEKGVSVEMRAPTAGAPDPNSILTGHMFQFPRTLGEKHPTADLLRKQWQGSRNRHGKRVTEMRGLIASLSAGAFDEDFRTPGGENFDLEKKDFIIDLIQHPKIGEAMGDPLHNAQATADLVVEEIFEAEEEFYEFEEGSLPDNVVASKRSTFREEEGRYRLPDEPDWNWRDAFEQTREIMRWANQMEVAAMLLQGQEVQSVNPEAENWEKQWTDFRTRANLNDEEAEAMLARLNRGEPVMQAVPFTDLTNGKNETEVYKFLDLRDEYASLDKIPESTRENMAPWMVEEFDFWKQWGINNYAPRVVQGNFVIKDAETGEPVARAPSGAEAQLLIKREQERGRLEPGRGYTVDLKSVRTSDIDHQVLPPGQMRKFVARSISMFNQGMDAGSAQWTNALTEALNLSELRAPQNPHTRARVADLTDTLEDPYQSLMVYTGRVSRQRHLVDVVRTYNQAEKMDRTLSRAYGTQPAFATEKGYMESYLEDLRDSYLGREGKWEQRWNDVMRLVASLPRQLSSIREKIKRGAEYDPWKDPDFLMNIYDDNYAGRRFTEMAIASQSIIRLGGNIGGAAANMTQTPLFVPPELMNRGATMSEAMTYFGQAVKDQRTYHREVADAETEEMPREIEIEPPHLGQTEEARSHSRYVHDLGIELMPAKGTQGTGLGVLDNQALAIEFSDTAPLDHVKSFSHHALMKPFTGAEQINRELTAFAARRMAQERGMNYDEQVAFGQEVINNTQFQYYDQALPPIMRGPLSRVIFQFKPFVANAMKFQVDMLKGMITGNFRGSNVIQTQDGKRINAREQAFKAMALHSIIGFMLGGTSYLGGTLLGSAAGSALSKLWRLFGNNAGPRGQIAAAAGYHSYREMPGPETPHSNIFEAWDLLTGGWPAFFTGVTPGQRIAVGGQDVNVFGGGMSIGDYLGPTAGWVANYLGAMNDYMGEIESPRMKALAGLGGGAASSYLAGLGLPSTLGLSALGMGLATEATHNPFRSWLAESSGGVNRLEEILPPWMQALRFHMDVLDERAVGASGVLRHYPPGMNTWMEVGAAYVNLQPIESVQERAYTNWLYNYYTRLRRSRNNARDRIVQAISDGLPGLAEKRRMDAIMRGLDISEESIDRSIRRTELGPVQKIMRRIPSLHQAEIEDEAEERFGGSGPVDVIFGGGGG